MLLSLIFIIFASFGVHTRANISITRSSFPRDFLFGGGSSSYQIEGATNEDGKGVSTWDYHTHKYPDIILDGKNGDIADDFYHRYKEDIKLMKDMGLDSFRFSISWTRILPNGNKAGGVNQLGIDFYNNLINELLANGIQPFATLYHWDIPHTLEEKYGGFLSPNVVPDFKEYANICFKEFGDRIKHWGTINEPNINARMGYSGGALVPNRCTRTNYSFPCLAGDSAIEPYLVGHHLLLAHAATVDLYKREYKGTQKGKIGIIVACDWVEPYDEQPSSKEAAERLYQHFCGWFFNPITYGEYPKTMRSLVGKRLPEFTKEQSEMLKKSYDFIGLNSYSGLFAYEQIPDMPHYDQDAYAAVTFWDKHNRPIGKPTPRVWLFDYPEGLERLLLLIKERYENPLIYITENGYGTEDKVNTTHSLDEYLRDTPRIDYVRGHLAYIIRAIKKGANVKGYFAWSFLDVYEWDSGYLTKFGFYYIDRNDNLKRVLKDSGKWFKNMLHSHHEDLSFFATLLCWFRFFFGTLLRSFLFFKNFLF